MGRFSTGLSVFAMAAVLASFTLGVRQSADAKDASLLRKVTFSAADIDPMPVGTARQVGRMKLARQASR